MRWRGEQGKIRKRGRVTHTLSFVGADVVERVGQLENEDLCLADRRDKLSDR